jgi:hypothetical protein
MIELIRHTTKSGKKSPFWLVVIDELESFKVASLDCAKRLMQKFTSSEETYEDIRKVEIGRIGDSQTERKEQSTRGKYWSTEGKERTTGEKIDKRNFICYPVSAPNVCFRYETKSHPNRKQSIKIENNTIREYNGVDIIEEKIQRYTQSDKMGYLQPEVPHQSFVGDDGKFYYPRTSVGSDSTNRGVGDEYAIFPQSNDTNDDNSTSVGSRTSEAIKILQPEKGQQDKITLSADRSAIVGIFERIHDEYSKHGEHVAELDGAYTQLDGAYTQLDGAYTQLDGAFTELHKSTGELLKSTGELLDCVDTHVIKPFTKLFYALGGTPEEINGSRVARKSTTSFDFPQRNITSDAIVF